MGASEERGMMRLLPKAFPKVVALPLVLALFLLVLGHFAMATSSLALVAGVAVLLAFFAGCAGMGAVFALCDAYSTLDVAPLMLWHYAFEISRPI